MPYQNEVEEVNDENDCEVQEIKAQFLEEEPDFPRL